jgi:hypothetical protein
MKHGQCPKCEQNLEPFSSEFFMFPFSFFCNQCKVKLQLSSWAPLLLFFFGYIGLMALVIFYVPNANVFGLGLIFSLSGFFVVYYLLSGYILNKGNLTYFKGS